MSGSKLRTLTSIIALALGLSFTACSDGSDPPPSQPVASSFAGSTASRWFELQHELIRQSPGFSPPVVSRALGYSGVALYEAVVGGMPSHRSLAGALNGLTPPPAADPAVPYHWGAVANAALASITRTMYPVAPQPLRDQIDALENELATAFAAETDAATLDRSVAHGRAVADWIADWSLNDGGAYGHLTNNSPGYTPPTGSGKWVPTGPNFAPALQARWGENRPFAIESGASCQPGPHPEFSTDPASAFYAEGREVYDTVQNLTPEQMDIALFWADNAVQTSTPAGHWVAILDDVVAREALPLDVSAEAYCKLGIAVADAFITCWYAKFDQSLLRPVTYIQDNIDPTWTTPIPTPPFPEYTSGHSVQSGAAAEVLSEMFGDHYAFTDDTHEGLGYAARSFASFREAAQEAAISRLYGGIHYRAAIENGVDQGVAIGREVSALPFRVAVPAPPAGAPPSAYDATVATRWFDLSLDLLRTTPGCSPPVASRALGYAGVALYESVRPGDPNLVTLAGQLNDLTSLPAVAPGQQYHWPSAANATLARIFRGMFSNTTSPNLAAIDALEQDIAAGLATQADAATIARSQDYGRAIADAVFFWSRSDGAHEGWARNFPSSYQPPTGPGLWVPTPGGFQSAMQPFWGENRPFALSSPDVCDPGPPPPYSEAVGSTFYGEAMEVYTAWQSLTQPQRDIALWWSDDPGTTPTPPGHSISMLTQVLVMENARLDRAAESYARVGIAVADAFISCWHGKFSYNLLRPVTYIQAVIDPAWEPILGTPPFPEYTSGHSVQSGAWAEVMTDMFGAPYSFVDRTNESLGYAARGFTSFRHAAEEAAISRLYGGIHYRAAIDIGVQQGRAVGQIVNALVFRR